MSTPLNPRRDRPSTYFVPDRSEEELARLHLQDQMLTASMGGVLPEQPDPTIFHSVLDLGCGTGGWLIEAARTYPTLSQLVGVDISARTVEYAQMQAKAQQVSDRVQFRLMDALGALGFPNGSFDLVNMRLGGSFVRTWEWPSFLQECQRVARRGGVIRITESDAIESNSPAYNRLFDIFLQALYHAGRNSTLNAREQIDESADLLKQSGLQNVQTRLYRLEYRAGTPEWEIYYEDMRSLFRTLLPFFRKWTRVPDDYDALYQEALSEMQEPGFVAIWPFFTAWGQTR